MVCVPPGPVTVKLAVNVPLGNDATFTVKLNGVDANVSFTFTGEPPPDDVITPVMAVPSPFPAVNVNPGVVDPIGSESHANA